MWGFDEILLQDDSASWWFSPNPETMQRSTGLGLASQKCLDANDDGHSAPMECAEWRPDIDCSKFKAMSRIYPPKAPKSWVRLQRLQRAEWANFLQMRPGLSVQSKKGKPFQLLCPRSQSSYSEGSWQHWAFEIDPQQACSSPQNDCLLQLPSLLLMRPSWTWSPWYLAGH